MTVEQYDVCIIGGGIHGVGVAQAAAAHGYSVLVLEQSALASGTSSRSSKLIHGGLRYLETGQLSLVKECLRERSLLLKLAPALVKLVPFHIPVYENTTRSPLAFYSGLALYALLGSLSKAHLFKTLSKSQWQNLDGLKTDKLRKVFRYWDAQTDDVALTKAVMQSAIGLGAKLLLPASFQHAFIDDSRIVIRYESNNIKFTCQSKVLVNATGPWVNSVANRINPLPQVLDAELIQGSHIVINGKINQGIYYVEAPSDKRPVLIMPWHGQILVGTTETPYNGDPNKVVPLKEDIDYLLETFIHYFPKYNHVSARDIVRSFAGIRVLPGNIENINQKKRETVLQMDDPEHPRVITIYGGKLTAYRATAEQVVKHIALNLKRRKIIANTRKLALNPVGA